MARLSEEKRNELEAFWRAHIQGWRDSTLNQREYCEGHVRQGGVIRVARGHDQAA